MPRRGFEPLRPKARPPQDRVSTNSTTSAGGILREKDCVPVGQLVIARGQRAGRSGGIRTPDRRFWRPLLYQLSYTPPPPDEVYQFGGARFKVGQEPVSA